MANFPLLYAKDGVQRVAEDAVEAVELNFDGWLLIGEIDAADETVDRNKVHAMLAHVDAALEEAKAYADTHGGGGGGGGTDIDGGGASSPGSGSIDGGSA